MAWDARQLLVADEISALVCSTDRSGSGEIEDESRKYVRQKKQDISKNQWLKLRLVLEKSWKSEIDSVKGEAALGCTD